MNIDITKKIKFLKLSQSSYDNLDIKDSYTFYKTEDNMYYEDLLLSYYNKTYNYYIAFYSVDDNSLNFCGVDEIPAIGTQLLGKTVTTIYQGLDDTSTSTSTIPWYSNRTNFKSVIVDITFLKYQPSSIGLWFYGFTNLTTVDLSFLDTSQTTIMQSMFYNCSSLDSLDLSLLDTSKVTNISYMFYGCSKLTSLDLSNFDTSQVTTMSSMFYNCTSLTTIYSNDNNFVITKVTSGTNMFYNCSKLVGGNGTIYSSSSVSYTMAHIDTTSNPGYFTNYLNNNNNNNKFLSNSNTKKHKIKFLKLSQSSYDNLNTKDSYTFYKTENDLYYENLLLSYEDIKMYNNYIAFYSADDSSLNFCGVDTVPAEGDTLLGKTVTTVYEGLDNTGVNPEGASIPWSDTNRTAKSIIIDKSFSQYRPLRTAVWFYNVQNSPTIYGLKYLNTSNVTDMQYMFSDSSSLTSLDLTSLDTSQVTTMRGMFEYCSGLTSLDLTGLDTSNVTNMSYMFSGCSGLTSLDVSKFSTSNVTTMTFMFYYCPSLTTIYSNDSKFVTTKVTSGNNMFTSCSKLVGGNGTKYSSSNVTYTMAHVDTADNPGYFTAKNNNLYSDIFKNNTPAQIQAAVSQGIAADLWNVGDSIPIILNGTFSNGVTFNNDIVYAFILGFDHNAELETNGKHNLALSFGKLEDGTDIYFPGFLMQDTNYHYYEDPVGWNYCLMRNVYCPEFFDCLPDEWQKVVGTTKKYQFERRNGVNEDGKVEYTDDQIFLMSTYEVGYPWRGYVNPEEFDYQQCYDYYAEGNGYQREEYLGATQWYTNCYTFRSFVDGQNRRFADSGFNEGTSDDMERGFAPCFTIVGDSNTKKHKIKFLELSQSSYDNLNTKDSYTFYKTENDLYYENLLLSYKDTYNKYIAFYSADDDSLNFCYTNTTPTIGSSLLGKTITIVYENIESTEDSSLLIPWYDDRTKFKSVIIDESFIDCRPKSTAYWFSWCSNLTNINLSFLNTSQVTNMEGMFCYCTKLTSLDLSNFNTSQVTNMRLMFQNCENLISLDLSSFNTSQVTTMSDMFNDCYNLTSLNLSSFDTSLVNTMEAMFFNCYNLKTFDLSSFDTSQVTTMAYMFCNCYTLNDNINSSASFDTSKVTDMQFMFSGTSSLVVLDVFGWDTSNVTNMSYMFYYSNVVFIYSSDSTFVTTKVTSSTYMFGECSSLRGGNGTTYDSSKTNASMAHIDTADNPGYFTSASYIAFYSADDSSLNFCGVNPYEKPSIGTQWLGKTVTTIYEELDSTGSSADTIPWYPDRDLFISIIFNKSFAGCTPKYTRYWFDHFTNCTTIIGLSYLNTSNVTNMLYMFYGCSGLATLDVSNWDTSNVTNMYSIFGGCSKLTSLDVSNWDTSNVTNMNYMFNGCHNLISLDVSNWNTSNVTGMINMFYSCDALTTIYSDDSKFVTTKVTNDGGMFTNCSKLVGGNGTIYDSSKIDSNMAHVDTADNPGYFTAK